MYKTADEALAALRTLDDLKDISDFGLCIINKYDLGAAHKNFVAEWLAMVEVRCKAKNK